MSYERPVSGRLIGTSRDGPTYLTEADQAPPIPGPSRSLAPGASLRASSSSSSSSAGNPSEYGSPGGWTRFSGRIETSSQRPLAAGSATHAVADPQTCSMSPCQHHQTSVKRFRRCSDRQSPFLRLSCRRTRCWQRTSGCQSPASASVHAGSGRAGAARSFRAEACLSSPVRTRIFLQAVDG
jgi:hypothetical protein